MIAEQSNRSWHTTQLDFLPAFLPFSKAFGQECPRSVFTVFIFQTQLADGTCAINKSALAEL
jgi:hypothetical protein